MAAVQLRSLIHYHIDNDLLDTANFLAGRLHALEPRNPDASHLLALTYQRQQRHKAAYDSAHKYGANGRHLGCAYVFAQVCLQLGRHQEGVQALEKSRELWHNRNNWNKHNETSRRHMPDAAAVLTVLGKLCQAAGDTKRAGDCYVEVHKANPFVWEAFDGLCKIGADLNIAQMFRSPTEQASKELSAPVLESSSHLLTPADDQTHLSEHGLPPPRARSRKQNATTDWELPTTPVPLGQDSIMTDEDQEQARPQRLKDGPSDQAQDLLRRPTLQTLKRTISGHVPPSIPTMSDPPSNPRRSNRLFGQGATTKSSRAAADTALGIASRTERDARPARMATGAKGRAATTVGRVVSGNRKIMPPDPVDKDKLKRTTSRASDKTVPPAVSSIVLDKPLTTSTTLPETAAVDELLDNFRRLAVGTYAASRFNLLESIQAYKSLPSAQRDTPWVLAQLGKAYYEMAEYTAAEDCFARLLKLQPSRVEDMEVYSTVLWHLKKDTALALLCHSLRDKHYEAPQTWVVIGNTFSLAREHDQAISAFRRATQLDKKFAYAWVLMGHEYIANEEFDLALYAFRKGVTTDRRGYGGWYGLGKALERMGKYEDAERHYRIATSINPSNATLLVCIGVVLEKLSNRKSALVQYTRALHLAPNSALARFKKARVLMHLRHFEQALVDLEVLRDQAPDEANVWFLLGKCYKGFGDKGAALRAFTTALNLDAKASPFIREAMETLDDDYEDDVESD